MWPQNQSRQASAFLDASPEPLISPYEDPDLPWSSYLMVVIVCSAVANFEARQTIRETWASQQEQTNSRVIFLLGHEKDPGKYTTELQEESVAHGDILQERFVDTYANLTLKSVFLLDWVSSRADNLRYVLKTDDDMFVNLKTLQIIADGIKPAANKNMVLMGSLICGATPIRDSSNKWYSPNFMYAGSQYPNYLSGTAYFMSSEVATKLLEATEKVPLFHLEDIYVTGMVSKVAGIRPMDYIGFSYLRTRLDPCIYSQIVSSHHLTGPELKKIWKKLNGGSFEKIKGCRRLRGRRLRNYGPGKCKWK